MPQGEQSLPSYLGVAKVGVGNNYKGGGGVILRGLLWGSAINFYIRLFVRVGFFTPARKKGTRQ